MSVVEFVWGVSFITMVSLLPIGAIRMLAYVSGQDDHTPGMRRFAIATLGAGVVAAVLVVVLTLVLVSRR